MQRRTYTVAGEEILDCRLDLRFILSARYAEKGRSEQGKAQTEHDGLYDTQEGDDRPLTSRSSELRTSWETRIISLFILIALIAQMPIEGAESSLTESARLRMS